MPDDHLSTPFAGRNSNARVAAVKGLLSALWSFLQHPGVHLEEHLSAVEERLQLIEHRVAGDLKSAAETRIAAAEEAIASVEHRLENDIQHAIRGRLAGIQARLEPVKARVIEDLKRELRRVVSILAIAVACASLALLGLIFALVALWTGLRNSIGAVEASVALATAFLLASAGAFGLLRSVLHRPHTPPAPRITSP